MSPMGGCASLADETFPQIALGVVPFAASIVIHLHAILSISAVGLAPMPVEETRLTDIMIGEIPTTLVIFIVNADPEILSTTKLPL